VLNLENVDREIDERLPTIHLSKDHNDKSPATLVAGFFLARLKPLDPLF
jgi:hypothetical protein